MTGTPEPQPPQHDPEVPVGDVVDPADVRRAPRIGAFLAAGLAVGLVLGVVAAVLWRTGPAAGSLKPGVTATVIVLAAAGLGTLVAGAWAVVADRRSSRR